ncbi:hypothetical protein [Bacillus aerolatus]|nr:hypothetical protein [Bacillus aerolatus]
MKQRKIEKVNNHFCLVREGKNIELCFYSLVDALSYASERKYENLQK